MPTSTFVFQLRGKALGVEIKGGEQRHIASMRYQREILSGEKHCSFNEIPGTGENSQGRNVALMKPQSEKIGRGGTLLHYGSA